MGTAVPRDLFIKAMLWVIYGSWNFYGYRILKQIKPKELPWKVLKFKLTNWFGTQSIFTYYCDLQRLQAWSKKMKRFSRNAG